MDRQPVASRALVSVGYDEAWATLEVEFVGGGVYRYFAVPSRVYAGLMAAESHGTYFDTYVKKAGYRHRRVR
jgi:KTSC domain